MKVLFIGTVLLLWPVGARAQVGVLTTDAFDLANHAAAVAFLEPMDGGVRVVQPVSGDAAVFAHLVPEPPPPPTHYEATRRHGRRVIVIDEIEIVHEAVSVVPELTGLALAFVDASGAPANHWGTSTVLVGDGPGQIRAAARPAWTDALARWASNRDAGARARLLMSLVAAGDRLAAHAVVHLLSDATLLTVLDHAARETLLHTAAAIVARPADPLTVRIGVELPRLHEPDAVPVLITAFRMREGLDPEDGVTVGVALESLTNHVPPADEREQTDAWLAWLSRAPWRSRSGSGERDRSDMLGAGWTERGVAAPAIDDVTWLAARIRRGPDELDREVATDLCEQRRGRNLAGPASAIDAAAATASTSPRARPTMSAIADACATP